MALCTGVDPSNRGNFSAVLVPALGPPFRGLIVPNFRVSVLPGEAHPELSAQLVDAFPFEVAAADLELVGLGGERQPSGVSVGFGAVSAQHVVERGEADVEVLDSCP